MFELLVILGLVAGVVVLASVFKVALVVLLWPIKALFWLIGGLFKLILLPFQFVGGIVFAMIFLPLLAIALCLAVGLGAPLLALLAIAIVLWVVGAVLSLVGSLLFGWC